MLCRDARSEIPPSNAYVLVWYLDAWTPGYLADVEAWCLVAPQAQTGFCFVSTESTPVWADPQELSPP